MRRTLSRRAVVGLVAGLWLLAGPAALAQPPVPCDQEVRSLRWLTQRYGSERTQLEFALATSEARRQAAEAEVARLKSAPGQK